MLNLFCGKSALAPDPDTDIKRIFSHLASSLNSVAMGIGRLKEQPDDYVMLYGPFLARAWMEVSLTALIGRLDPFRLLTIQRMQLSTNYETAIPWKSAIRWQGDIMAKGSKDLFSPNVDVKDIHRALFGDYYDHLVWRNGIESLADAVPLDVGSRGLTELLAIPANSFCARKREAIGSLYSELSKSIHFESVTPAVSLNDRVTVAELLERTIRETAEAALVCHFVPHAYDSLSANEAIHEFSNFELFEVVQ